MPSLSHLPPPSTALRVERLLFGIAWTLLCRWTPRPWHAMRRMVLRAFGARIHPTAHVYPDCKVWWPRRLTMGPASCLGPGADCYNVADVVLDEGALVSQQAWLCTAGHDIHSQGFELCAAPIRIGPHAWVAAHASVLPGVTMATRSVLAAAAILTRDTEPSGVYAGNPARRIGTRRAPSRDGVPGC